MRLTPGSIAAYVWTVISNANRKVNTNYWNGTAVASPNVAGVPKVDGAYWNGAAVASPTVAGVPKVDAAYLSGTALSFNTAPYLLVDTFYHKGVSENVLQSGRRDVYVGAIAAGSGWHVTNNQRAVTTWTSAASPTNPTISSVTLNRARVSHLGQDLNTNTSLDLAYVKFADATHVNLTRSGSSSDQTEVSWEVEDSA